MLNLSSDRYRPVALALCAILLCTPPSYPQELSPESEDVYLLQAGDELEISVWDHPDLSRKAMVREDGTFPFPLLDSVEAADRPLLEIEHYLQEELTRVYNALQNKLDPTPPEQEPNHPDIPRLEVSSEQVSSLVYRLRYGDEIRISVWGHGDLNQNVQVREDGAFSFPLIGAVKAAGRSLQEIEGEIRERLDRDYIVNPQVTAQLLKAEFFVLGAVVKPGTYLTEGKMDLVNAISQAGGVTQEASGRAEIIRGEGESRFLFQVNLGRILQGMEPNINIMPRDAIYVKEKPRPAVIFQPKELQVTVRLVGIKFVALGEVENSGAQIIEGPMDLLTAVSLAGGLTKFGSSRVEIIRTVRGKKTVIRVNLDRILKGKDPNIPIFPRDTLYVRRRLL